MILVRNLTLLPEESPELLTKRAAKKLGIRPERILSCRLQKRSLDARKKNSIRYVCSAAVSVRGDEKALVRSCGSPEVSLWSPPVYTIRNCPVPAVRPVIAGFGPAGMFAGLVLSRAGLRPIILERGQDAVSRRASIEAFHSGGPLDPENNVQFGEGGAGTFSDGKLNTGTHDPRISWVLDQFYQHGAPESVLYDAKPHIGTDLLVRVVQNIRKEICALGGEVRFGTRLESLATEGGRLIGVTGQGPDGSFALDCDRLILAVGHSARDTFLSLHRQGVPMERKPFAMGVRIEHRQDAIDLARYGRPRGALPAADYGLHVHLPSGRSAFTFCMCPGGHVFAAASEPGGIVTNGMSFSARDGENANAAVLVGLKPEDFPGDDVLAGMYWQREIEQAAFRLAGGSYRAPAQLVGDFLRGLPSSGPGLVLPSYRPGVTWTDLRRLLPPVIGDTIALALPEFGRQLSGFDHPDAVLTGPETRSSSPVRILRGENLSSPVGGLYPCGEGAGYAGGITSAAVDGMRCAEAVISSLSVDDSGIL